MQAVALTLEQMRMKPKRAWDHNTNCYRNADSALSSNERKPSMQGATGIRIDKVKPIGVSKEIWGVLKNQHKFAKMSSKGRSNNSTDRNGSCRAGKGHSHVYNINRG